MSETGFEDNSSGKEEYHAYIRKKIVFIVVCILLIFIAIGVSLNTGASKLGFSTVYQYLFDHIMGVTYEYRSSEWLNDYLIWNSRLPRTLFAIVAGAGLAVAGAAMQSVMHNPLADPYTTGISSGAQFGVSISIILGFDVLEGTTVGNLGTTLNAFVFALIPTVIILLVSPRMRSNPSTIILVGTAVSYMFNSINMFLMITTDAGTMSEVYTWLVGSFSGINWNNLEFTTVVVVICSIVIMFLSNKLNIMSAEDDTAKSLGIDADKVRFLCLVSISLLVATVTCFAGIIGFVGLVSPHIVRSLIDSDNRYLIPASAAFSALFLLVADIISRTIASNGSVPVGVVMSFIGAPIFLYLIVRRNSSVW